MYIIDEVLKINFSEELLKEALRSSNHKTRFSFVLKSLLELLFAWPFWYVYIKSRLNTEYASMNLHRKKEVNVWPPQRHKLTLDTSFFLKIEIKYLVLSMGWYSTQA